MINPPISKELIGELIGKTMVVCNKKGYNFVSKITDSMTLLEDGSVASSKYDRWDYLDSHCLRISGECESIVFNGISSINGIASLTGIDLKAGTDSESNSMFNSMSFISKKMSSLKVLFVVSSSVGDASYVGRCVASLLSNGVRRDDICIVVSGSNYGSESSVDNGILNIHTRNSYSVYTPISISETIIKHKGEYDYFFIVNDTTSFVSSFSSNFSKIEVGLNFDFISIGSIGDGCEMGLYSKDFFIKSSRLFESFVDISNVYSKLLKMSAISYGLSEKSGINGNSYSIEGIRDVYGIGIKMEIRFYSEIGIKKYSLP